MKQSLGIASLIATLTACGGKASSPASPSPAPTSSADQLTGLFEGTFGGQHGQTGTVSITITPPPASAVGSVAVSQVSGTMHVAGGATTALTGTYDSSKNAINLSGGEFTLLGWILRDWGGPAGTYTGSADDGGTFSTLHATGTTVKTFCGAYSLDAGDAPRREDGIYNIQVSANGNASGNGISTTTHEVGFLLHGSLNGTTLVMQTLDLDTEHSIGVDTITVEGETFTGTCNRSGQQCSLAGSTSRCQ